MADAETRGRKMLKQRGNVQLWQETVAAPRGRRLLRYLVGSVDGAAKAFDKPHHAWEHFQQLTAEKRPAAAPAPRL